MDFVQLSDWSSEERILELEAVSPGATLQPRYTMFYEAGKGYDSYPHLWKDRLKRLLERYGCSTEGSDERPFEALHKCFVKVIERDVGVKKWGECPFKKKALHRIGVLGEFECARAPDNALIVKHIYGPRVFQHLHEWRPFMAMRYTSDEVVIKALTSNFRGQEALVPLLFSETIEKLGGSCTWGITSHPYLKSYRHDVQDILTIQCRHNGLPPEVFAAAFFFAAGLEAKEKEAETVYWKLRPLLER